jgi:plasmid stabilization system protein ParE
MFIDADRSDTAASWFNGLHHALRSLAEIPQRCPFVPESVPLRYLLYCTKPHIYRVIFSIDEPGERVVIHTIRHGARAPLRK